MMLLAGCDISHHQGDNFIKQNSRNYDWFCCKATEGVTWKDDKFQSFVRDCLREGKAIAAYHYARPDNKNSALNEANNFLSSIKVSLEANPGMQFQFFALDVEDKALRVQRLAEWVKDWIKNVKNIYPSVPVYIYIQASAWQLVQTVPNHDGFWIACYDGLLGYGDMSRCGVPFDKVIAKQYRSNPNDMDVMYVHDIPKSSNFNVDRLRECNATLQAVVNIIDKELL